MISIKSSESKGSKDEARTGNARKGKACSPHGMDVNPLGCPRGKPYLAKHLHASCLEGAWRVWDQRIPQSDSYRTLAMVGKVPVRRARSGESFRGTDVGRFVLAVALGGTGMGVRWVGPCNVRRCRGLKGGTSARMERGGLGGSRWTTE